MESLPDFQVVAECAVCRPERAVSCGQFQDHVFRCIARARQRGASKLLLLAHEVEFRPPGLGARYFFAAECARLAEGRLCMAVVARPEMIDPHRFGIMVARNRGLKVEVFTYEAQAHTWLKGCHP